MIELLDTIPDTKVHPAEYKRLLGYPPDWIVTGRARELSDWARAWYARNGRPWVYARQAQSVELTGESINIDGETFVSKRLHGTLDRATAHGAVIVAVSAGPEIEEEAQRLWLDEKPDEYYFLEIYGSAVVEHLTMMTGARLCAWADGQGLAVLPHYSPGYPEWDISQQPKLMELVRRTGNRYPLPAEIDVLASGMLRPKKSLLAVFGLTSHVDKVRRLTELVPCESCSYVSCQFRRAPDLRAAETATMEIETSSSLTPPKPARRTPPLDRNALYATSIKALERWAAERLTLEVGEDGTVEALFHYEGTTCSNMGRPLFFDYRVKLGPREDGYPILVQSCTPTPGDDGYTFMCRYMSNAEHLMVAIDHEKPLQGQPLNDVISWERRAVPAGCYCEPNSRKHKWGLVLETIHYALVQREEAAAVK